MDSITAQYLENLGKVSGLWTMAAASRAGVLNAYYDQILMIIDAEEGGLMFGTAAAVDLGLTAGLPVIAMVGVAVALGSGYYQAREEARNDNFASGFSQGFVMAILDWDWRHAVTRFGRTRQNINHYDEQMDSIRVSSYHSGLKKGYLAGRALPPAGRKAYAKKIRSAGGIHGPKNWSENDDVARNQQISYVIDMASTARKLRIIAP